MGDMWTRAGQMVVLALDVSHDMHGLYVSSKNLKQQTINATFVQELVGLLLCGSWLSYALALALTTYTAVTIAVREGEGEGGIFKT